MQSRHVDFIYTPLVVDYLRLKFSAGLPNPFRETKWRREHGRVDRNLARFMLDEDESKLVVYILQGGCADSPRQAAANRRRRWGVARLLITLQGCCCGLAGLRKSFCRLIELKPCFLTSAGTT